MRYGVAFWLTRADGAVLLRRRPENGLLGGMTEIPSTPWRSEPWTLAEAIEIAPAAADWVPLPGTVRHGFTHFRLELAVVAGRGQAIGILGEVADRTELHRRQAAGADLLDDLLPRWVGWRVGEVDAPGDGSGCELDAHAYLR